MKLGKHLLVLFVVMATCALALGTVYAQEPVELTLLYWNWGPDAVQTSDDIASGFMALNPDVTVTPLGVEGTNWGTYLDGVSTLIAGGERPDVMLVASEGVQLLVASGLALPLDDFIAEDAEAIQPFIDDVAPAMLDALKVDGKQYLLPFSWNNMVMYLNTARLAEAGLEMPPEDWTRDQFLDYARALTVDADGDGTPEQYGYAWDNSGMFISALPWVFANGVDILTDDYCAPQVTDPQVIEALQFMHDLIYVEKVAPAPTAFGDIYNLFQNGNIAMFGAGRWSLTALLPSGFRDFDIQYFPGNPTRTTIFGIGGYPILSTSEHPEVAWELVKYLSSVEVQEGLVGSEEMPFSNIPARRSVAEEITAFPPPHSNIFYDSLEGDTSLGGDFARIVTSPPRFNQMENIFLRYSSLIFADEMSVEDAMAAAQQELSSVITCN